MTDFKHHNERTHASFIWWCTNNQRITQWFRSGGSFHCIRPLKWRWYSRTPRFPQVLTCSGGCVSSDNALVHRKVVVQVQPEILPKRGGVTAATAANQRNAWWAKFVYIYCDVIPFADGVCEFQTLFFLTYCLPLFNRLNSFSCSLSLRLLYTPCSRLSYSKNSTCTTVKLPLVSKAKIVGFLSWTTGC